MNKTKVSIQRHGRFESDFNLMGYKLFGMSMPGGDSSTVVNLSELNAIRDSLNKQIDNLRSQEQTIDITDGAQIGAIPLSAKGSANGVATLGADLKIPVSQIPLNSIRDIFVVANLNDVTTLFAQKGDVAYVENTKQTYILAQNTPGNLNSWIKFITLADIYPIQSVHGRVGDVIVTAEDIAAVPLAHPNNAFWYNPNGNDVLNLETNVVPFHVVNVVPDQTSISLSSVSTGSPKYVEFTTTEILTRYTLTVNSLTTGYPVYWELMGSDDNFATATTVDERIFSASSGWGSSNSKEFNVTTPNKFLKWRMVFYIGGTNLAVATIVKLANIEFGSNASVSIISGSTGVGVPDFYEFKTKKLNPTTNIQSIEGSFINHTETLFHNGAVVEDSEYELITGASSTITSVMEPTYTIGDISAVSETSSQLTTTDDLIPDFIPQFNGTSTSYGGLTISASVQLLTGMVYKLFDKVSNNDTSYWDSGAIFSGSGYTGNAWFLFDFGQPRFVQNYALTGVSSTTYSPKTWVFEASNDASVWTTLHTVVNNPAIITKTEFAAVDHTMSYRFYRITFTAGYSAQIRLLELNLFNRLYSNITRLASELTANPSLYYQNYTEFSQYTIPSGLNNTGMAIRNGAWRGLFRWDNGSSKVIDMYTMSNWVNNSVNAPKSWKLYGSNDLTVNPIPAMNSNYTPGGYNTSYFTQVVVPDRTVRDLSLVNGTTFNSDLSNYMFSRTNTSNDYFAINNSDFATGTNDYVFSLYVKWDSLVDVDGYNRGIMSSVTGSGANGFGFALFSGKITCWTGIGGNSLSVASAIAPTLGTIYQLTQVRRSNVLYFYVDGSFVGSVGVSSMSIGSASMWMYSEYAGTVGYAGKSNMHLFGVFFKRETRTLSNLWSVLYASPYKTSITSSSEFSTSFTPFKSFDNAPTANYWKSLTFGGSGEWLKLEIPNPVLVRSYTMKFFETTIANAPKSWQLLASNDGTVWTKLHETSNETEWYVQDERFYSLDNTTQYRFYKINITENNGGSSVSCRPFFNSAPWIELSSISNEPNWDYSENRYYSCSDQTPVRYVLLSVRDTTKIGYYMVIKNFSLLQKVKNFALVIPIPKNKIVVVGQTNYTTSYNLVNSDTSDYWNASYPVSESNLPLYVNLTSESVVHFAKLETVGTPPQWVEIYGTLDGISFTILNTQRETGYSMNFDTNGIMISIPENTLPFSRYKFKIYSNDGTSIRIKSVGMYTKVTGSESGIQLNIADIHPSDKVTMKYIGN